MVISIMAQQVNCLLLSVKSSLGWEVTRTMTYNVLETNLCQIWRIMYTMYVDLPYTILGMIMQVAVALWMLRLHLGIVILIRFSAFYAHIDGFCMWATIFIFFEINTSFVGLRLILKCECFEFSIYCSISKFPLI